jgi:hypothetical protein
LAKIAKNVIITSNPGFWPNGACPSNATNAVERIFPLSCDPLTDLPAKNLFLRQFHENFLIESSASFDCKAGSRFDDGVSRP